MCSSVPRGPCAAASTAGAAAVPTATAASRESGPVALDLAVPLVEWLANSPRDRETEHVIAWHRRVPLVLDVEESPMHRPPHNGEGD